MRTHKDREVATWATVNMKRNHKIIFSLYDVSWILLLIFINLDKKNKQKQNNFGSRGVS